MHAAETGVDIELAGACAVGVAEGAGKKAESTAKGLSSVPKLEEAAAAAAGGVAAGALKAEPPKALSSPNTAVGEAAASGEPATAAESKDKAGAKAFAACTGVVAEVTVANAGGSSKAAGKAGPSSNPVAAVKAFATLAVLALADVGCDATAGEGAKAVAATKLGPPVFSAGGALAAGVPDAASKAFTPVLPNAGGSSNPVSKAGVSDENILSGMGGGDTDAEPAMVAFLGEPGPERAPARGVDGLLAEREPAAEVGLDATKGAVGSGLMGLGAPSPGSAFTST